MALLADGWHMGTHAAAFAITIFAYRYARRHADSKRFAFGTAKVSVLGGFASAVALVVVALMMAAESIHRLFSPREIRFNEAIGVAVVGLAVNLFSALCCSPLTDTIMAMTTIADTSTAITTTITSALLTCMSWPTC